LLVVADPTEANANKKVQWLISDHLGTPRMTLDKTGSLSGVTRHDYLPFGEELTPGMGDGSIRSTALGYAADSVRLKFGSKERDTETGLDYLLARYYSSGQGRFISVDPENVGADPDRPQTWNGYSYALNRPVVYSDPDGRKVRICNNNGVCTDIEDSDANRYFYNKKYQEQSGYRTDGKGNIFDSQGSQIGTYENVSIDGHGINGADQLLYNDLPNALSDPRVITGAALKAAIVITRPIKPANLPSHKKVTVDMVEVETGHMAGGGRAAQNAAEVAAKRGKDMFPDYMTSKQVERSIRDAYTHSEILQTQGTRVKLKGVTRDGTIIEMWFNRETKIIET